MGGIENGLQIGQRAMEEALAEERRKTLSDNRTVTVWLKTNDLNVFADSVLGWVALDKELNSLTKNQHGLDEARKRVKKVLKKTLEIVATYKGKEFAPLQISGVDILAFDPFIVEPSGGSADEYLKYQIVKPTFEQIEQTYILSETKNVPPRPRLAGMRQAFSRAFKK